MYQKYQTEALVLKATESGEADKVFALYTHDFGLVRARASAVRSERSKMRYALQQYSHASVSLVRGKRGWRIAGAAALRPAPGQLEALTAFARIASLVLRLVHGEESNAYLFGALAEAHEALAPKPCDAWPTIEIVCVARVLFGLGYLSKEAVSAAIFTNTTYALPHLAEVVAEREKLLATINRALSETQL
ncbi:MAG TPA: recombination protein O N-terminal domain-containing protein [Candidatus Paceibacterota bacterium]|nr:recombination protein O N-terminal domain-containing protein [Candidatus Paceibacterota bacterium]